MCCGKYSLQRSLRLVSYIKSKGTAFFFVSSLYQLLFNLLFFNTVLIELMNQRSVLASLRPTAYSAVFFNLGPVCALTFQGTFFLIFSFEKTVTQSIKFSHITCKDIKTVPNGWVTSSNHSARSDGISLFDCVVLFMRNGYHVKNHFRVTHISLIKHCKKSIVIILNEPI